MKLLANNSIKVNISNGSVKRTCSTRNDDVSKHNLNTLTVGKFINSK